MDTLKCLYAKFKCRCVIYPPNPAKLQGLILEKVVRQCKIV